METSGRGISEAELVSNEVESRSARQSSLYLQKRKVDNGERTRKCREQNCLSLQSQIATEEEINLTRLPADLPSEPRSFGESVRLAQRLSADVSCKIALFSARNLKGVDPHIQNDVIVKFFGTAL
jgi:hypothetical protein